MTGSVWILPDIPDEEWYKLEDDKEQEIETPVDAGRKNISLRVLNLLASIAVNNFLYK